MQGVIACAGNSCRARIGLAHALVALVAWLALGSATAAETVVGSVLAVRGAVFTDSAGSLRPLSPNAPVHEGDAIVSRDGKAQIAFDDGSIVSVGENTRVQIGEHERAPGRVRARLALVSGALRMLVAKVTPRGNFEVETETAIAAVRGTEWLMDATSAQTSVALLRGKVSVSGRDGHAAAAVMLELPGHGTDVRRNAAPTPPVPWGARRLADLLARATFN